MVADLISSYEKQGPGKRMHLEEQTISGKWALSELMLDDLSCFLPCVQRGKWVPLELSFDTVPVLCF